MSEIAYRRLEYAIIRSSSKERREMHDERKQQARAAWKRRQARKREREALAESVSSKHEKTQG